MAMITNRNRSTGWYSKSGLNNIKLRWEISVFQNTTGTIWMTQALRYTHITSICGRREVNIWEITIKGSGMVLAKCTIRMGILIWDSESLIWKRGLEKGLSRMKILSTKVGGSRINVKALESKNTLRQVIHMLEAGLMTCISGRVCTHGGKQVKSARVGGWRIKCMGITLVTRMEK